MHIKYIRNITRIYKHVPTDEMYTWFLVQAVCIKRGIKNSEKSYLSYIVVFISISRQTISFTIGETKSIQWTDIKREVLSIWRTETKRGQERILDSYMPNGYVMSKDTPTNPRKDICCLTTKHLKQIINKKNEQGINEVQFTCYPLYRGQLHWLCSPHRGNLTCLCWHPRAKQAKYKKKECFTNFYIWKKKYTLILFYVLDK